MPKKEPIEIGPIPDPNAFKYTEQKVFIRSTLKRVWTGGTITSPDGRVDYILKELWVDPNGQVLASAGRENCSHAYICKREEIPVIIKFLQDAMEK